MKLELITLTGPKLQGDVYEVILPTADGSIAVYYQHMPLVATVIPGVIAVRHNKNDPDERVDIFATNGGVAEINGRAIRLLVDEADSDDEIVEADTRAALARAEEMKENAKDQVELAKAQSMIDRQAVRLKVTELKHRRHRS